MNIQIKELYEHFLKYPAITTDSRKIKRNAIFFALKGESFDGNKFALQAIANGCSLAVVDDPKLKKEEHCLFVEDVLTALQELAKHHRSQLKIPVIGITGSNGKTTTKELIYTVLSQKYNCLATQGNLNNHIGVPLSILSITPKHEMAIIEMGANHIGEIKFLCGISRPDYGIITNIGKAHLEGFGDYEGVIKTKSELYEHLKQNGSPAFVNADNELLVKLSSGLEIVTYGFKQANCVFSDLKADPFVKIKHENKTISSQLIGKYNAENIMAACCIGKYFKVSPDDISAAVEKYIPQNQRSEIRNTKNNSIILDAYNANPSSMKQALENFKEMKKEKPLLILGDMFELGNHSLAEHKNIVDLLSELGFKEVLLAGEEFEKACDNKKFLLFKSTSKLATYLKTHPVSGKNILIKGSRGMKLETILPFL